MKKILLLILLFMICCSCNKEKPIEESIKEEPIIKDEYVDNNPVVFSSYQRNGNKYYKISEYRKEFVKKEDIIVLQTFASTEEEIDYDSDYSNTWLSRWKKYDNELKYKIGYILEYTLSNGMVIKQQILSPEDADDYYDYIEIYLYDDVYHANDSFYSHITINDFYDDSYLTSIKITAGSKIEEVNSNITVTSFSYDADDFDEEGYYKGISKYIVILNNTD